MCNKYSALINLSSDGITHILSMHDQSINICTINTDSALKSEYLDSDSDGVNSITSLVISGQQVTDRDKCLGSKCHDTIRHIYVRSKADKMASLV